jgi:hypothetical protein
MKLALLIFTATLSALAADPPQFDISNANVKAKLYIPDAATGYYQATRFDWAGAIASLEWKGHSYFGKWFDRYDPKIHDSITGPVEEFSALGYDEAAQGGNFVKIGVGALVKPVEPAYQQFKTYDIADPGRWIVITASDHVDFLHYLNDTNGYAYEYRKTVRITLNGLVLDHSLRNTGKKTIATSVYEHNFYMLDAQPSGPGISVKLPFAPKAEANLRGLAEIRGNEIAYLKELQARETIQTEITGFSAKVSDYDIRVENHASGAAVRQTSDRPMSKMVFWSIRNTVCPEAYIELTVEPGKETTWRIQYEFYTVAKQ